jgi:pyruvate formate lyase activating enzyme
VSPTESGAGSAKAGPRAVVFDIQRLSLKDGPGIRTTVFLKGCSLRCRWCHNPESFTEEPRLLYAERLCVHCGECVAVCPTGAQSFAGTGRERRHAFTASKCDMCGACLEVCCHGALEACGRSCSVPELLAEIEVDRPYYRIGEGGGLTLSGGEPMLQADFIEELLRGLEGVDVRIETSGQAPRRNFERLAPLVDGFLFDYKATGSRLHEDLCGAGNELILGNLDYLCAVGAKLVLRLPLVPGVNDGEEHLAAIAALLQSHPGISGAEIMPYHNLGASKAERLGLPAEAWSIPSAEGPTIEGWLSRLSALGARNVRLS